MRQDLALVLPEGCKAVIFDMDAAFYDDSGLATKAVIANLNHPGIFSSEKRVRKDMMGKDFTNSETFYETFFDEIAEDCGAEPEYLREWYNSSLIPKMVRLIRRYHKILPGVKNTVWALRKSGIKVVVLSDYEAASRRLKLLGFDTQWADHIFESPTLGGLLPCPQALQRLCIKIGLQPQECLFVGNKKGGIAASKCEMPFQEVD